ncbi:PREDICTED: uncharacterized protein LOC105454750 isoform X3 [Wasmannia auropunctata]|nr:PREDICTED: uncharacterized protein LOC105454750 isoform X3 [Wasmannia auropunctata]
MCAESYHGNRDKSVKRPMIAMIRHCSGSVRISRDIECVACHDVRRHRRRIRKPPTIMEILTLASSHREIIDRHIWGITAIWRLSILWITGMLSRQDRPNTGSEIYMSIQPTHRM